MIKLWISRITTLLFCKKEGRKEEGGEGRRKGKERKGKFTHTRSQPWIHTFYVLRISTEFQLQASSGHI
jgi:hypothetical protein